MNKKQKGILILVMIWAGLLVAVLYSPIGSPELYAPISYSPTVEGASGKFEIGNSPKFNYNTPVEAHGSAYPVYQEVEPSNPSYAFSGDSYESRSGSNSDGNYYEPDGDKTGNGPGGAPMEYLAAVQNRQSSRSGSASVNSGVVSLTTDLTSYDNGNTNERPVGYAPGAGATDPGDNPEGNPIPVGDGLPVLLFLALGYFAWKRTRP